MILVVDDEEAIVRLEDAILTRSGFEVVVARTGKAALDTVKLKEGRIAVALLDVRMPGIDGISLIPMLREADPNIAIVLTSGYLGENVLSQFEPEISFLQKPFTCDELLAAVEAALMPA